MEVLFVGLGCLLGAIVVYIVMKGKIEGEVLKAKGDAEVTIAELRANEASLNGLLEKQEMDHKEKTASMTQAFELAAKKAFEGAVESADKQKENAFSATTSDFKESLKEYQENIKNFNDSFIAKTTEMDVKIGQMNQMSIKLSEDTNELAKALKSDSQKQGAWGELVLENLLQSLGFKEGTDYQKQFSDKDEEGKIKRPDFVVNLPDGKNVVIDSKVSLTAWTNYCGADDEAEQMLFLKDHCTSIKNHAKGLASKNYQALPGLSTPDFVFMFVPLEPAFAGAMTHDTNLYKDLTSNSKVKVVTGSTLAVALMLIQELWQRELQTKNQQKLVDSAGALHDKFVTFLDSYNKIGERLTQVQSEFDKGEKQLTSGTGNLIKRADDLRLLGAKVKKELPQDLVIEANLNAEKNQLLSQGED